MEFHDVNFYRAKCFICVRWRDTGLRDRQLAYGRLRWARPQKSRACPINRSGEPMYHYDRPRAFLRTKRSLEAVFMTLALAVWLGGCASSRFEPDPELSPSGNVDRVWMPPPSITLADQDAAKLQNLRRFEAEGSLQSPARQEYDLPALLDLALRTSPQTANAWYTALAANAQLGQSQAINYPKIEVDAEANYLKLPLQFPGQTLVIRNEVFQPQLSVSYDLLDFGRTVAIERSAREQLIAANFAFNQAIQDLVFNVEKAYYILAAANASVSAAEANLKLARTSLGAVQERHQVGLATQPQVLLAKQVEAQAVYDLENAKSMVHDAEGVLRQGIGVAADTDINVKRSQLDVLPKNLGNDVETLMEDALKQRPDIAAQIAAVRASDAAIARARSEFYPEVEVSGNYGQIIWSYTINGGNTQNLNQPFYGALITLRWNLFTGFDRYYGLQKATAERDAARTELKSLQLNVIAAVWTAYCDFLSAKKKRDASEALVDASEESYQANLLSHRHGLATVTDLIGAERDLMAARYTLIQSRADLLISSSALLHATGMALPPSVRSH
jgi:outer membrane protein